MLGFSLSKILFTLVVIAALVYGWKWFARGRVGRAAAPRARERRTADTPPAARAVDMVACPSCGDYVPARGARNCGRGDCPYLG